MKLTFSLWVLLFSLNSVFAQVKISLIGENTAKVKFVKQSATFDERAVDFGEVKKGQKKETVFSFINSGTEALEIELVSACECTTLDWTRGKIGPKEKGDIYVLFDSTEKEESGTIDVDIYFKELEKSDEEPLFEIVTFSYILTK